MLGLNQRRKPTSIPIDKEGMTVFLGLPSGDYDLLPAKSYQLNSLPQLFHILSIILSFSDRPNCGSSRPSISSKNPSRSRDRAGSDVNAYSRRCAKDRTKSPVVKGGISSGCTVSELRR